MMRKITIIIIMLLSGIIASAQKPSMSLDSLERYINRYVRNSSVESFTNLRMNTVLINLKRYADSAIGAGTLDTAYRVGDSLRVVTNLKTFAVFIGGGGTVNLSKTTTATTNVVTPSGGGTPVTINQATGTAAGLQSSNDKKRLDSNNYILNALVNGRIILKPLNDSTIEAVRLNNGYGTLLDSAQGQLTIRADTVSTNGLATQYDLSQVSGGTGAPAGVTTQIQYNKLGAFAGDAGLTYNETTNAVGTDSVSLMRTVYRAYNGNYEIIRNQQADTPTIGVRPYAFFSRWHEGGTLNEDGQRDYVDGYGYNTLSNGNRWNLNEAALWWATEGHYIAFPGANPQFEWYMQTMPKSGSGGYRIMGIDIDKITAGAIMYFRTNSMQFFPSGSSATPYLSMTPGSGIFSFTGTAPQLNIVSTGGSPNSSFRIVGTNDGSGVTNLTSFGGMGLNSASGFNFQSTAFVANHDYYLNSNHSTSSGFIFSVLKQGVQKLAITSQGQVGIGLDWLSGANTNYTGYKFQVHELSLLYKGLKVGGEAGGFILDSSAIMDIESSTKGFLAPRMTQAQRDLISTPATGLLVYQTNNTPGFYSYNGSSWGPIKESGSGMAINSSITSATVGNLLISGTSGRLQQHPLIGVDSAAVRFGIGTLTPTAPLHIYSTLGGLFSMLIEATSGGAEAGVELKAGGNSWRTVHTGTSGSNVLEFRNAGVPNMWLKPNGELNLGTSTDNGAFTLQNTGGFYTSGIVRMNLGSDATRDLYFRNASGNFQRIPYGTTGQVLTATTGADPSWITPAGESGLWTPTLTNGTNVAASTTHECMYFKQGNVISFSGYVEIDPTVTATNTELGISLPPGFASSFADIGKVSGTMGCGEIAGLQGSVRADVTNSRILIKFMATDINNNLYFFIAHYYYTPA